MGDTEVGNVLYRLVLPRTYRVGDDVWVKIQSSIRGPAQGLAIYALEDMHLRMGRRFPTVSHPFMVVVGRLQGQRVKVGREGPKRPQLSVAVLPVAFVAKLSERDGGLKGV